MTEAVFLEVDGTRLVTWDDYSVDSDLLVPSDGFTFGVSLPGDSRLSTPRARRELREKLRPGATVKLYVGDDTELGPETRFLQMTGVIDDSEVEATRENGTVISLTGRDLASYLVDASVRLDIRVSEEMGLLKLIEEAVRPWGMEVLADSFAARETLRGNQRRRAGSRQQRAARSAGLRGDAFSVSLQEEADRTGRPIEDLAGTPEASAPGAAQARQAARAAYANGLTPSDIARLKVADARPAIGETVWSFCERHCKRLGVMMWFAPEGRIIVSSPHYTQDPSFSALRRHRSEPGQPNNIISGGVRQSIGERFSKVTVYGKGNPRSSSRSVPKGTATDESWPSSMPKEHIMQDDAIRSDEQAARRALRELNMRKQQSFMLNYELTGHGQGPVIYSIDNIVSVVDDAADVRGNFFVTRRTFKRSRSDGTKTTIAAVPVGSIII